jgi:hypothetical protein
VAQAGRSRLRRQVELVVGHAQQGEADAGLTNVEISQALFLSPKTVANNVSVILAKLNLSERGKAIIVGRDAGLGRADPSDGEGPGGPR